MTGSKESTLESSPTRPTRQAGLHETRQIMTPEDAATTTAARCTAATEEQEITKLTGSLATLSTASSSENRNAMKQFPDTTQEDNREHAHQKHQQRQQQQHPQQQQYEQHQQEYNHQLHDHQQQYQHQYEEGHDGGLAAYKETQVEPKEDSILFIGDLARGLTEADLVQAFECVGKVQMVDIKRDKLTMRNLGYGFVQMSTREEAAAAKKRMQDVEIQGRRIRVGWAQRNTALFIGDLDASTTIDDLHRAFGLFGPLYEDQTYLRQGKYGKYGSCKFAQRQDAETARREMHGRILGAGTYPIRVVWHHPQTSSTGSGGPSASTFHHHSHGLQHVPPPPPHGVSSRPYSVHVQFEAEVITTITEGLLHSFFAPFGEVIAVILPQGPGILSSEGERTSGTCRRGYGFVHFSGSSQGRRCAIEAIRTLQGEISQGIRLQCAFSKKPGAPVRLGEGVALSKSHGSGVMHMDRGVSSSPPTMMQHYAPSCRPLHHLHPDADGGVEYMQHTHHPSTHQDMIPHYFYDLDHQHGGAGWQMVPPFLSSTSSSLPPSSASTATSGPHLKPYQQLRYQQPPLHYDYHPQHYQPQEAYFHGQPPPHNQMPPYDMPDHAYYYSPPHSFTVHLPPPYLLPPSGQCLDGGRVHKSMGSNSESNMGGPGNDLEYHEGTGYRHDSHGDPQGTGMTYPPTRAVHGGAR
ncbi:hypothetical protein VYU27_004113 [Nannochloropsis oceanica]